MENNSLPLDIREFLLNSIETVSQLEILFLTALNPEVRWSHEQMSKELRSHPTAALRQMEHLKNSGILKSENGKYFYSPTDALMHEKIMRLRDLYREKPVSIVTFIYDRPNDKLKGFADAFKFKKD